MKFRRSTYQNGCVYEDVRRPGLWYFRYREGGKLRNKALGRCKSESDALRRAAAYLPQINREARPRAGQATTVAAVIERYKASDKFPTRFSTASAYTYNLDNHIMPQWGHVEIAQIDAEAFEGWLNTLELSPKTKVHLRGLMGIILKAAMFWKYLPKGANEMGFVTIKGASKRGEEPAILTVEQFHSFLGHIEQEPYRTMILTAMCLGLRVSELLGLQWGDMDWENSRIRIQRGIVRNRVDDLKTRYSAKSLPIDSDLAAVLKLWRVQADFKEPSDWIWASPAMAGQKPLFYTTLQGVVREAATKAGLEGIGWHTFRHSYRSWLDETKAPIGVQQKLMRHADIRTTMNVYGDAIPETLRRAHKKVVRMALRA